jgi:hypothetical protein
MTGGSRREATAYESKNYSFHARQGLGDVLEDTGGSKVIIMAGLCKEGIGTLLLSLYKFIPFTVPGTGCFFSVYYNN